MDEEDAGPPSGGDIAGYGGTTFDNTPLVPPKPEFHDPEQGRGGVVQGPEVLTQEQAKAALLELCSQNCCYGKTAATEMTVQSMTPSAAYLYRLETFTETRATAWAQEPFKGGDQPVDTAANGAPPLPWDVQIFAKEKFKSEKKELPVPHTASVKGCHQCTQTGEMKCDTCKATGKAACSACSGKGSVAQAGQTTQCTACGGSGQKPCAACNGRGLKQCTLCKGFKQLIWFIQLTVNWTNHLENFVHYVQTTTSLPDDISADIKADKVTGTTAFTEEHPWVYPISQCPEPAINKASLDLVTKHREAFPTERLLLQRQTVKIIPVTEVKCQWGNTFTCIVYGLNHQAYSADYPQKFCWGKCTIL